MASRGTLIEEKSRFAILRASMIINLILAVDEDYSISKAS